MWESLKVCHHPTKFGDRIHHVIRDTMVLVSLMILQNHLIKGSCAFIGNSPSRSVIILPSLVTIYTLVV